MPHVRLVNIIATDPRPVLFEQRGNLMKHGSWQRFARGRTRGVTLHAARITDISVIVNNNLQPRQFFSSTSARNDHKASQGSKFIPMEFRRDR